MKPIDLWNKYYTDTDCRDNRLYLTKYNLKVNGKQVYYIEKINDEYALHLCNPEDIHHYNYSIYGTPSESLTYKFALALRRDFGLIPMITDKDYVVNSYHVDPREEIDCFSKLEIEGKYLALSSGGAVSYVETLDLSNNIEAILEIIKYMHTHIVYAEFNRKIGVCFKCGYEGDIDLMKTKDGQFKFICPNCGNEDDNLMDVTARICGYLGKINSGNTNKGRLDDIFNRVIHTDCKDDDLEKLKDEFHDFLVKKYPQEQV